MAEQPLLRLFVAVDLAAPARKALTGQQRALQGQGLPISWSKPALFHITLVFLGDTPAEQQPAVSSALRQACAGQTPFTLALGTPGVFPNPRTPSVFWVGVQGETSALAQLQQRVAEQLAPLGYTPDHHSYTPHITLGYLRRGASPAEAARAGGQLLRAAPLPAHPWRVEQVRLYQSTQQNRTLAYLPRDTIALAPPV